MYCIGKKDLSNHTQMCTIQLNVTEEYSKTSTDDQKIPLKIFFVDLTRALLPFKKVPDLRDFSETSAETFPIEMNSSRRRRMSNKRKKERKEKEAGKKRKRTLALCAFLEKMPHSYHGPNPDLSFNAWFKPNVQ